MEKVTGIVTGVNGNLITAEFDGSVKKNEVCYVCVKVRSSALPTASPVCRSMR